MQGSDVSWEKIIKDTLFRASESISITNYIYLMHSIVMGEKEVSQFLKNPFKNKFIN